MRNQTAIARAAADRRGHNDEREGHHEVYETFHGESINRTADSSSKFGEPLVNELGRERLRSRNCCEEARLWIIDQDNSDVIRDEERPAQSH